MLSFKSFLAEKRSHADKNPKRRIDDIVRSYAKDENIFISMSELNKVGVNPHQKDKFGTPVGIYAYPLKTSMGFYGGSPLTFTIGDLPFRDKAKYAIIFKPSSGSKLLYVSKYTWDDLHVDLQKINDKGDFANPYSHLQRLFLLPADNYEEVQAVAKLKNLVEGTANPSTMAWAEKILKHMRAVPYSPNPTPVEFEWGNCVDALRRFIEKPLYTRYPVSVLFWASRESVEKDVVKWNSVFRKTLKYDGVVDDEGLGVIHENEPVQAVFFHAAAVDVQKVVLNTSQSLMGAITTTEFFKGFGEVYDLDVITKTKAKGGVLSSKQQAVAEYYGPDVDKQGKWAIRGMSPTYRINKKDLEAFLSPNKKFSSNVFSNLEPMIPGWIWGAEGPLGKSTVLKFRALIMAIILRKLFRDQKQVVDMIEKDPAGFDALIERGYKRMQDGYYSPPSDIGMLFRKNYLQNKSRFSKLVDGYSKRLT